MAVPGWLEAFLAGNYFAHCRSHVSSKNERNHFCVDCCEGPLCHSGLRDHLSHTTLQVRRASHMDAVRINDLHKLLDTTGIQPYTINGAKIAFLLSRPQSRLAKGSLRCCETCGRSISDPLRFCSISCKL
ncbi:hypothetical protein SELMODRAFT_131111, partial [Selaginella moellendorffii]